MPTTRGLLLAPSLTPSPTGDRHPLGVAPPHGATAGHGAVLGAGLGRQQGAAQSRVLVRACAWCQQGALQSTRLSSVPAKRQTQPYGTHGPSRSRGSPQRDSHPVEGLRAGWPGKPTLGTPCCCCLAPAVTWVSPVAPQPLSWWLQVPVCIPRPLLPLHLPGVAAGATCSFLLATKEFFSSLRLRDLLPSLFSS